MNDQEIFLCAIIPTYNEAATLIDVIKGTLNYVDLIVLVDDGSTDETPFIIQELKTSRLIYERHLLNQGKGKTLSRGIEIARHYKPQIYVFLDSDGEHNPSDIPQLVMPIIENKCQASFGIREVTHSSAILKKRTGDFLINKLFGLLLSDPMCGFKAYHHSIIDSIPIKSNGYSIDVEMAVRSTKAGFVFREVLIDSSKVRVNDEARNLQMADFLKFLEISTRDGLLVPEHGGLVHQATKQFMNSEKISIAIDDKEYIVEFDKEKGVYILNQFK